MYMLCVYGGMKDEKIINVNDVSYSFSWLYK